MKRRKTYAQRRAEKRARNQRVLEYYNSGSYYGIACATVLYELARQLNKADNNLLWCAIVGLTDQYVNGYIDLDRYMAQVDRLRTYVCVP